MATIVASLQPINEKRQINAANGSIIVGYARTAVPLSAVEGEAKNVSRRVPLATNPLCRQANNASAPLCGKEGDDSISLARSGERSEKALPKALCTREVSDNSASR